MSQYYCLLVCCVFIGLINLNNAEKVESEPSTRIDRLLTLQNQLQTLQDDISSSITALQNARNSDFRALESSAIEKKFHFLNKELDNFRNTLESRYDSGSLRSLPLPSNPKEYNKDEIPSDIIADIREQHFESAEEKLKRINNLEEVPIVIREVYENNSNNFDLLAKFIESLSDINLIYASVKALQSEIVENGHSNPFKCIRLSKVLETRFINYPKTDYFTKEFGQLTNNKLKEAIRHFTLEALNAAVTKADIDGNEEMNNLAAAVYHYDPYQWEDIIYEFVNSNIDNVSKVLDVINSHPLIEQRVSGVNIVYWSIQFKHSPKSDEVIRIASILKEIRSDSEFQKANPLLKELVDKIIENLPTCARNLFFVPSTCLWNPDTGMYLTAANSSQKNEHKRRQIFTTDPLPGSHWYFNKIDNYFVISSRSYEKELLHATNTKHSSKLRHVFSRLPKSHTKIEERSKWSIELNNDICYVKSVKYSEYLMTSNLRYVFTWVPKTFYGEPQFQWQIRDCN